MAKTQSTALVEPPLQHWSIDSFTISQSGSDMMSHKVFEEREELIKAVLGRSHTPLNREKLSYIDRPSQQLCELRLSGGRGKTFDVSLALVGQVEIAWRSLKQVLAGVEMPVVVPGDDVISMCWVSQGNRLEVSFSLDEESQEFVFDWVKEAKLRGKEFGDLARYDPALIAQLLRAFSAER